MPYDRFLIGSMDSGLQTDTRPWQILDNSWALLKNAYSFRGRMRKRFGSYYMGYGALNNATAQFYSRLSVQVATVMGGNAAGTVPGNIFKVGQMFSIGSEVFTVYNSGAGNNPMLDVDLGTIPVLPATTKTYNVGTGAYSFTGLNWVNGTPVYWYPAQPVMGITTYENGPLLNHPSYAFDTQFAYVYANGFWQRSGNAVWHGSDANFFWSANWEAATDNATALFTSNFQVTNPNGATVATDDPIWATQDGATWNPFYAYFLPNGGAPQTGPFVQSALIMLQFHNRFIFLNTIENDNSNGGNSGTNTHWAQRCRYSAAASPFQVAAWYEAGMPGTDSAGNTSKGAGILDAATQEQIVSAEFIKDRLIVYFETSTWELVFTGNNAWPFQWQKINTELGSQSTFSTVPFDKAVLTIGNVGVHACNGANVERIDTSIPNQIFQIRTTNSGIQRIQGIRDYYAETSYWCYPSNATVANQYFPNEVLVYNYQNQTWAINDDCITAFGYFEQQQTATWANTARTWENLSSTWASGTLTQQFRQVIAGNQQGYMFIVDVNVTRNAAVMQITNITNVLNIVTLTIINHTLRSGDYISINNAQGVFNLNNRIYQVSSILSANSLTINTDPLTFSGTYTGGGTVTRVSNIQMKSKQWNPYLDDGQNFAIIKIEFCVSRTSSGAITVDYAPSASRISSVNAGNASNSLMGTSTLSTAPYAIYPLEQTQERLWHPVYIQTSGTFIQLSIYMSPQQITNPAIAFSDFQLEALELVLNKAGRLQ